MRLGLDHADDRDGEGFLKLGQRRGGRRVAGDEHELDPLALEIAADLERVRANLVERSRPVRQPRMVAEVDEVLVRHRHEAFVQHRQPAGARVEHPDRPLVHGG